MSRFRLDDEFFSPIRFDTPAVDEISNSSDDPLDTNEFVSLIDLGENKITMDESMMKLVKKAEFKSKDNKNTNLESVNAHTPVLRKIDYSDKSIAKKQSSKLKCKKIKEHEIVTGKKKNVKSQQKKQISPYRESILDPHNQKSKISDKPHQESLSSKNKNDEHELIKDIKKRYKCNIESSKYDNLDEVQKSSIKQSVEKISIDEVSNLSEHSSDTKYKDSSTVSTLSKTTSSINFPKDKESNYVSQQIEKSTVNPIHSSYETSIEKMIHSSISLESAKIRQNMYIQQMSLYREINKIKDKMEKQHFGTTERLFKVIEELMQMNASLRLTLSSKD